MSSRIIQFYRLIGTDTEGRRLDEIWTWPDERTERVHDFIQWMFPMDQASGVNPDAPLLTKADRAAFAADPMLATNLRRSLKFFLNFLGLEITPTGQVTGSPRFQQRIAIWNRSNHNWLRITRMLKSLRLLGLESEAQAVWNCLRELHEKDGYVSEYSFEYWREAAAGLE
jgi:hypothetical protein